MDSCIYIYEYVAYRYVLGESWRDTDIISIPWLACSRELITLGICNWKTNFFSHNNVIVYSSPTQFMTDFIQMTLVCV